jgi:hypothetical protein
MEKLNKAVQEKLDEFIDTLPRLSKGENKGEFKRKTIMPKDLGVTEE